MAKYIDADKVIAALTDTLQYEGMVMDELISVVANIPAADVEPVIHCKDCENYELTKWAAHRCTLLNCAVYGNDYCSKAERREDG